jgi:uncharacterized membrane protein
MAIAIVPLADPWAIRSMQICVRSLGALPLFARDLVDLLVADAASVAPALSRDAKHIATASKACV